MHFHVILHEQGPLVLQLMVVPCANIMLHCLLMVNDFGIANACLILNGLLTMLTLSELNWSHGTSSMRIIQPHMIQIMVCLATTYNAELLALEILLNLNISRKTAVLTLMVMTTWNWLG